MPKDGVEIYITPLETAILIAIAERALHLTDKEIVYELRRLADKLDRQKNV